MKDLIKIIGWYAVISTYRIIDYTSSAMQRFADPAFDGEPVEISEEEMDEAGNMISARDKEGYEIDEEETATEGGFEPGGWEEVDGGERKPRTPFILDR